MHLKSISSSNFYFYFYISHVIPDYTRLYFFSETEQENCNNVQVNLFYAIAIVKSIN